MKSTPGLIVAAGGSSAGKTTVTLLLAAWARRQGLDLRGFKVGPDFIDPQYLSALTGKATPSLDPWFLGPAALRRHYLAYSAGGDLALAEGVMGLYDGKRGAAFGRYSTAEVARTLGLPVLLVLDARKAGVTLATQALGLQKADPRVRFAGVVLNRAMGQKSVDLISPALKKLCGVDVLGWLPTVKELALPERHLGLTAPTELAAWQKRLEAALPLVEAGLQPAKIFGRARAAAALGSAAASVASVEAGLQPARIVGRARPVFARTGVLATADGNRTAAVVCTPNHHPTTRPTPVRARPGAEPGAADRGPARAGRQSVGAALAAVTVGGPPTGAASASSLLRLRNPAIKIAVALDQAFHFYYPENLALLRSLGAEPAFFSPLRDKALPTGSQGLLVGGGFPESFGKALAANRSLRLVVKAAIADGLPVWAECGGLMWLAESLVDLDGKAHAMVGALPAQTSMSQKLQHFGYTQARFGGRAPWGLAGAAVKGHEFHHSLLEARGPLQSALDLEQSGRPSRREGWRLKNGLATYFHAYWPSQPKLGRAFVDACRRWGNA